MTEDDVHHDCKKTILRQERDIEHLRSERDEYFTRVVRLEKGVIQLLEFTKFVREL